MGKIQKIYIILLIIISYWLLIAIPVNAARLYFEPQEKVIGTEKEFQVAVKIDAEKPVNLISPAILISSSLKLFDVIDGNSIINFWIEKPTFDETSRLLTFSGVIPGGFSGKEGNLLIIKLSVNPVSGGFAELSFNKEKTKVFLNTPAGLGDSLELNEVRLPIVKGKENISVEISDTEPPEDFKPEIAKDPNIFEGKYFLVFVTQDKKSGIDHYEVCEKVKTKCVIAESPYLLQNQKLDQKIFVKAIDKSGNERMAKVEPRYPMKWYEVWWIWGIIILGIVAVFMARKFK